jgi:hypothetical protein
MLALPNRGVFVQLTSEEVEATVATTPFDVPNRQSRVLLCEQLKSKPLKRVPIELAKSLIQGVHANHSTVRRWSRQVVQL